MIIGLKNEQKLMTCMVGKDPNPSCSIFSLFSRMVLKLSSASDIFLNVRSGSGISTFCSWDRYGGHIVHFIFWNMDLVFSAFLIV